MKIFAFLLIFNLMAQNVFAATQTELMTENQIRSTFQELVNDSKFMHTQAEAEGFFDVERKEVFIDHLKKILADHDALDYLVNHMINVGVNLQELSRLSVDQRKAYGQKLMQSALDHAQSEGMARLLPSQQLALLRYKLYIARNISSSSCKALVFGGVDENVHRETKQAITRMNAADLREFLWLGREAILAGIKRNRSVSYLTKEQEEISEKLLEKKLIEYLTYMPLKERNRILHSMSNPNAVTDSDACEAVKTYLEIVTQLPGVAGDWYRSKLFY